uniref:THAP-type domain-containing protein n=1 Tax=Glossina brevipalpis TaxID=37001 RepID=A0A1A9W9J6_9MUSC
MKNVHGKKCVASDCTGRKKGEGIRFFTFPKDAKLRKKWCENLGINEKSLRSNFRVCSRHFELHLIGTKKLNRFALPTVALGLTGHIVHRSTDPIWSGRMCAAKGCTVNRRQEGTKHYKLFQVPRDETGLWWAKVLSFELTKKVMFVCEKHFSKHDVGKLRLYKGALPKTDTSQNVVTKQGISNPDADTISVTDFDMSNEGLNVKNIDNIGMDESTETALTVLPVERTYERKGLAEYIIPEEIEEFSGLKTRARLLNFGPVKCSEECRRGFEEKERKHITRELKLSEENEQLKEKIKKLEEQLQKYQSSVVNPDISIELFS